jgi:hypothetical protein
MAFTKWMARPWGRALRVLAGLVLMGAGYFLGGAWGWVIGIVGVVPVLAGAFDFCLIGPLFGAPLNGRRVAT